MLSDTRSRLRPLAALVAPGCGRIATTRRRRRRTGGSVSRSRSRNAERAFGVGAAIACPNARCVCCLRLPGCSIGFRKALRSAGDRPKADASVWPLCANTPNPGSSNGSARAACAASHRSTNWPGRRNVLEVLRIGAVRTLKFTSAPGRSTLTVSCSAGMDDRRDVVYSAEE